MDFEITSRVGMLALWSIGLCSTIYGAWLALRHLASSPPHLDAPFGLFPVSILKPLKGADSGLRENLETFFHLDYPEYELLFSVADRFDPAVHVVEELRAKYPHVRSHLVIGQVEAGINPKVNNLISSYGLAKHDWVLISDSNVRVKSDYLKRLVAHIDTNTGIVSGLVAGRSPAGVGGQLEAVYLNTFYLRGALLAARAGKPCVIGKQMLFRRSVARRFGGIQTLARYLAEDYMAGEAMRRLGLAVVTTVDPVDQHIGEHGFDAFWSRHIRWGRIRKAQGPLVFLFEPWMTSIASGLLGALALHDIAGLSFSAVFAAHLTIWSTCDLLVMRRMGIELEARLPLFWFARELLHLPLWINIAIGNTVDWRGQRLVIRPGGLVEK